MKKTVLYIAAVLAVSGGLMWQKPMVAHAEPEVIQEAPVSTVLEVAAEEDSDEDNGPAPEIQAAKKLEEELAAAETAAAEAAAQTASARQNLVDYALQFVGGPYRAGGNGRQPSLRWVRLLSFSSLTRRYGSTCRTLQR